MLTADRRGEITAIKVEYDGVSTGCNDLKTGSNVVNMPPDTEIPEEHITPNPYGEYNKTTCPGATGCCSGKVKCPGWKPGYCGKPYLKNEKTYRPWKQNLQIFLNDAARFAHGLNKCLDLIQENIGRFKKPITKYVRYFGYADSFSQKLMDIMIDAAIAHPELRFAQYTKAWWLDFSRIPKNLNFRISVYPDSKKMETGDHGLAFAGTAEDYNQPNSWLFSLYERAKSAFICPGDCPKCRFCWNRQGDVIFPWH